MVFKSLFIIVSATFALAAPYSGGLTVKVTPSSTRSSSKDIVLTAVIENPTKEDIRFIKYGTVADDEFPTRSFLVTKDDKEVTFIGISVYPDLNDEVNYVTIPAGGELRTTHSIGFNYDFVSAGVGPYTFQPILPFHATNSSALSARALESSVTIEVTEVVAKQPEVGPALTIPTCDDNHRRWEMERSLSEARALAGGAATNIRQEPNSADLNAFFGGNNRDTLWWNFDRIAGDLPSAGQRPLYCTGDCQQGWIAYAVTPDYAIHVCEIFYGYPWTQEGICGQNNLRDTKGAIILHELTHVVVGTNDHAYFCNEVQALPDHQKISNADSYNCFASRVHRKYAC